MSKRKRRNALLSKSQANTLRAILRAHGYAVVKRNPKRKHKRKAKRRHAAHRRAVKAPKRLRSGTSFKRRGRKYTVVVRVIRVNGRKVRVRYARKA